MLIRENVQGLVRTGLNDCRRLDTDVHLKRHLGNALNVGLTPEQLVELIIHDTWYGAAPASEDSDPLNSSMLCWWQPRRVTVRGTV